MNILNNAAGHAMTGAVKEANHIAYPRLGVIVVNWNRADETIQCLQALSEAEVCYQRYLAALGISEAQVNEGTRDHTAEFSKTFSEAVHVVVVDNGSKDGSPQKINDFIQAHPAFELLESPQNLGFTGGYNLGIQHLVQSSYFINYFLLLNDDSLPAADLFTALIQAAISNPEAGFLGPKIMTLENKGFEQVFLSAGGIIEAKPINGFASLSRHRFQTRHRGLGELDQGQYDQLQWVDFLSGCALMVKREVIDKVGLLDEQYFAYYEEVDWCYRAQKAGLKALFVPTTCVWHPDTRQRDENSAILSYYMTRNSLLFVQKHKLGKLVTLRLLAGYCRTWLSWRIRPRWRTKKAQRQALAQALRDFLYQRFGQGQIAEPLRLPG